MFVGFEVARGHKIERENYLSDIKNREKRKKVASIAIDTENDKGTQCLPGYWIDQKSVSTQRTGRTNTTSSNASETETQTDPDCDSGTNTSVRSQVSLWGHVNVQRKDLIPDGKGGFFVHIRKQEIQSNSPPRYDRHPGHHLPNRSNRMPMHYPPNDMSGMYNSNRYHHRPPPPQNHENNWQPRGNPGRSNDYSSRPDSSRPRRSRFSPPPSSHAPQTLSGANDNWRTSQNHASLSHPSQKTHMKRSRFEQR